MHITIRRYKTASPKEVTPIVNERFFPLISSVAGFVAYYGIELGEDGWLSISVFETAAGAEESNRVAAKFIKDNPDLAYHDGTGQPCRAECGDGHGWSYTRSACRPHHLWTEGRQLDR